MRLIAWNCNMALHRKAAPLRALAPDVAVICECASPDTLRARGADWLECEPVWVGTNPHKGLAVFAFNGYAVRLAAPHWPSLRHIAPVHVTGPMGGDATGFNLLAVWAQNASGGTTRKRQPGPLRRALLRYRDFLTERPAVVAGDLNSNAIWDKPGWRINHMTKVERLAALGLVSAYHALRGERHGAETTPTLYWRDRSKDGPTYHIDYVFLPEAWLPRVRDLQLGTFEAWCGRGLSDHVPIVVDVDLANPAGKTALSA
jgi:exodeoxyribonuclease-3